MTIYVLEPPVGCNVIHHTILVWGRLEKWAHAGVAYVLKRLVLDRNGLIT